MIWTTFGQVLDSPVMVGKIKESVRGIKAQAQQSRP